MGLGVLVLKHGGWLAATVDPAGAALADVDVRFSDQALQAYVPALRSDYDDEFRDAFDYGFEILDLCRERITLCGAAR